MSSFIYFSNCENYCTLSESSGISRRHFGQSIGEPPNRDKAALRGRLFKLGQLEGVEAEPGACS